MSTLCYPYGLFRDDMAQIASATGYADAVTTRDGCSAIEDPAFALRRLEVRGDIAVQDFIRLLAA